MKKTSCSFHQLLLYVIMAVLFLPLIGMMIRVKPLQGAYYSNAKNVNFSFKGWFQTTYQVQKEAYLNNSFGFRNICVRVYNQVDYSLFNKAHAQFIVAGKNGYLFETHYIDGFTGADFIGADAIKDIVNKLIFINDTLKKLHKLLLLVIAPNRAQFFAEYLPGTQCPLPNTNYNVFTSLFKKSGIDYIDFNRYFLQIKYKSKYPLEPKNGAHWSVYGAMLARDSIVKYIEIARHISMPHVTWSAIRVGRDSLFDRDIEEPMNLIFRLGSPQMAYPNFIFKNDSNSTKPNVLTIGDSYFWVLPECYGTGIMFSSKSKFWYYFKKHDNTDYSRSELKEGIANHEVIMILATAHNWASAGWGFIDSAYALFKH